MYITKMIQKNTVIVGGDFIKKEDKEAYAGKI